MIAGWFLFIAIMSFLFGHNIGRHHGIRIMTLNFNDMMLIAIGYLKPDVQEEVLKAMKEANRLLAVCEPKK